MKKKSIHYVDNKKFLEEMVIYNKHCADVAERDPDALVPIKPDYIGDCFMRISHLIVDLLSQLLCILAGLL